MLLVRQGWRRGVRRGASAGLHNEGAGGLGVAYVSWGQLGGHRPLLETQVIDAMEDSCFRGGGVAAAGHACCNGGAIVATNALKSRRRTFKDGKTGLESSSLLAFAVIRSSRTGGSQAALRAFI